MTTFTQPIAQPMDTLKNKYPAYYRAWKSMISNYGKNSVDIFWRGTIGFMRFIEDTSELDNSPSDSKLPEVLRESVKLKRINNTERFSPDNVIWAVCKVVDKELERKERAQEREAELLKQLNELPSSYNLGVNPTDDKSYELPARRIEDKEERVNQLFEKSIEGTITKEEERELDILAAAVATRADLVEASTKGAVDLTEDEAEVFYNKRWSDL